MRKTVAKSVEARDRPAAADADLSKLLASPIPAHTVRRLPGSAIPGLLPAEPASFRQIWLPHRERL